MGKRTVIISTNKEPMYAFFEPITIWAWKRVGWNCICIHSESVIESQMIRLYQGDNFENETILMTSDIDMIPLSDYWNPNVGDITCYGRNLSNEHQPICYIAMKASKWLELTGTEKNIYSDIEKYGKVWSCDQNCITDKLIGEKLTHIPRPISPLTGYPVGRIDRSAWDKSLQQTARIDSHLLRPGWTDENWTKIIALITDCLNPTIEDLHFLHTHKEQWIKSHS